MPPARQVGFRCPPELFAQIQALVGTECKTTSDAIILLIQRGLTVAGDVIDADVRQRLTDVEQRLTALEKRSTVANRDRPGASPGASMLPPEISAGGDGAISDATMRRRWANAGKPVPLVEWAESQGYRRDGKGNSAKWLSFDHTKTARQKS